MKLKDKRGVAGMDILKSVVVTIFILGLLLAIFAIMNTQLKETTITCEGTSTNESVALLNGVNVEMTYVLCGTEPTSITNATNASHTLDSGNFTITTITGISSNIKLTSANNGTWNVSYSYETYPTEYDLVDDTSKAMGSVPGWFTLIITITIMVVLIFLVSMIIRAVKGSGMETATPAPSETA